jgi:hypothetical protein
VTWKTLRLSGDGKILVLMKMSSFGKPEKTFSHFESPHGACFSFSPFSMIFKPRVNILFLEDGLIPPV